MASGGGGLHVALTKAAIVRMMNRFDTVSVMSINFEENHSPKIQFGMDRFNHYMNRSIDFRPDFVIRHNPYRFEGDDRGFGYPEPEMWDGLEWSQQILFEVETDPKNMFNKRKLKIEYYRLIKEDERNGRFSWAFVLVLPEGMGSKVPEGHPFDEVWEIPEKEYKFFMEEEA